MPKVVRKMPDQETLLRLFVYDPDTGSLKFRVDHQRTLAGAEAGHVNKGHVKVGCLGSSYVAHRIIWVMMTGEDPGEMEVDHRDRCGTNNRWLNLRLADLVEQQYNKTVRKDNKLGVKGVHKVKTRYRAQIRDSRGIQVSLGYFKTSEEAGAAYAKAARELHGEFYAE